MNCKEVTCNCTPCANLMFNSKNIKEICGR